MYLPKAFTYKNDVTITGSTLFIPLSRIGIGALMSSSYEYCMNILRGSDEISDLVIGNGACRFANVTVFDLSVYPNLETLTIGNSSITDANELRLIGLSELESVEIGMNSFRNSSSYDPNRHFYVKNCPKLKSLKVGSGSFSDYSVIEIESMDALEVIEIGGWSFEYASLELKSNLIHRE